MCGIVREADLRAAVAALDTHFSMQASAVGWNAYPSRKRLVNVTTEAMLSSMYRIVCESWKAELDSIAEFDKDLFA